MILEQVLLRKLRAISMDDTLKVTLQKLRELDRVESPIVASFEEQDADAAVQIFILNQDPDLFVRAQDEQALR